MVATAVRPDEPLGREGFRSSNPVHPKTRRVYTQFSFGAGQHNKNKNKYNKKKKKKKKKTNNKYSNNNNNKYNNNNNNNNNNKYNNKYNNNNNNSHHHQRNTFGVPEGLYWHQKKVWEMRTHGASSAHWQSLALCEYRSIVALYVFALVISDNIHDGWYWSKSLTLVGIGVCNGLPHALVGLSYGT